MARFKDYEDLGDEDQIVKIKIVRKSKKITNDQNIILNKKKPWKKRRNKIKAFISRERQITE